MCGADFGVSFILPPSSFFLGMGSPVMADLNDRDLKNTLQQIEKQFGKGSIMQLGGKCSAEWEGISTGALSLDIALGGRGLPRARIIVIFGSVASG